MMSEERETSGYPFEKIESRWQKYWVENETFKAEPPGEKPKLYILDMFCNSQSQQVREAAAGLLAKMIADKLRGLQP